jgi:hypothetical protein
MTHIIAGLADSILESYNFPKNKLMQSLYQSLLYLHIAAGSLSLITGVLYWLAPTLFFTPLSINWIKQRKK